MGRPLASENSFESARLLPPRYALQLVHQTPLRLRFRLTLSPGYTAISPHFVQVLERHPTINKAFYRRHTSSLILELEVGKILTAQEAELLVEDALQTSPQASIEEVLEQELQEASPLTPWMTIDAAEVTQKQEVNRQLGLSEAEILRRRQTYGSNDVEASASKSSWQLFVNQFSNGQTALLAGSAVLSLATGGLLEVFLIGGVVLVNAYISYLSEAHAEKVISSLGQLPAQEVRVIRGGIVQSVLDRDLVVGDIVLLSGGVVPADMRLLESKGLMVDESPLTGESMPVAKHHQSIDLAHVHGVGDRRNLLLRGTIVTSGQAVGLVLAVGASSEIGQLRRLVDQAEQLSSPLQRELSLINKQTLWVSASLCAGILGLGLLRGRSFFHMLHSAITLAVAAVPEGLPTIGTTTMALGVSALRRQNVIVRRLNVLEMLGSVEVLCLDKTGTLTLNDMVADQGYFGWNHWTSEEAKNLSVADTDGWFRLAARRWAAIAALCSDCEQDSDGVWHGSATETALVELAVMMGQDPLALRQKYPRFKTRYRTEVAPYMATFHTSEGSRNIIAVKGSPEHLIDMCSWILEGAEVKELNEDGRQLLRQQNQILGKKGLRVLAFAYLEREAVKSLQDQALIWVGLVGLMDPMREGMAELMERFHQAGIQTLMMTGDQSDTAKAVGKALSLGGNGKKVKIADARQIQAMSLDEIADLAQDVQIFSRVSPSDKLKIVQALQQRGKIVAMTGDGINDSPALKAAHVGIAMGAQGTAAARESADIVLQDDNLAVLFHAIEQGRTVRGNMRKSIQYLLATNLSEILLMLVAELFGQKSPLNPMQLLWINMLSDILPGLALALDPPKPDTMRAAPEDPKAPLLDTSDKLRLLWHASLMSGGALFSSQKGSDEGTSSTASFVSLTLSQILHTLSASAGESRVRWRDLEANPKLLGAMGVAFGALVLGAKFPRLQKLLGMSPLGRAEWGEAIFHGVWPFLFHEATKSFCRSERQHTLKETQR